MKMILVFALLTISACAHKNGYERLNQDGPKNANWITLSQQVDKTMNK
jgi:hypothetical protein